MAASASGSRTREGAIQLRLGPMETGAAEQIREELEVPDVGGSLEALVDELSVEALGRRRVPADQLLRRPLLLP